ncbi:endonuclease domain-containing protein [uncultured Roseibium sp.]|uniref:endonuclease domain-containing protein n=1 Tax=uncultured Roseibium sp. TaxID=1936171 RepID=UPI0026127616|nr:endonuclease domain-containing protein [uncultured Roseibium sp.]
MSPTRISERTRRLAHGLRLNQTQGEKRLWRVLRELKTEGVHVRRQAPIGSYVADFAIFSRKIIVEIDGDVHSLTDQIDHDRERDAWLSSEGFEVVRYSSAQVSENLEGVVLDIRRRLDLE